MGGNLYAYSTIGGSSTVETKDRDDYSVQKGVRLRHCFGLLYRGVHATPDDYRSGAH